MNKPNQTRKTFSDSRVRKMNLLLDSPVEALAFSYVSFGILTIVNNLWTWVAVITAAVSFWKMRASGAATDDQDPSTSVIDRAVPSVEEKPTAPASVTRLVCNDGVTKNGKSRFAVYYYEDDIEEESDVVDVDMKETEWSNGDGGEWWESWERVLSLRKGEMGWYRYQDLTALNGNVVRLWDESCRSGR